MEEIEEQPKVRRNPLSLARSSIERILIPDIDELRAMKDHFEETQIRLARMTRQRDNLEKDIGLLQFATWRNLVIGIYNPDEIDIKEYKKMVQYDGQVRTGYDLIEMGVLMKPWRIRHPDQEVVKTITNSLQSMRRPSLRESMKEMMSAILFGNSVTEIVFEDYKGKYWMPRRYNGLKTLDPELIRYYPDSFGNIKKVTETMSGQPVDLPLERTLIWTHNRKWGNPYGESILQACYKNWFIKDAMLKFANIAYERFGSPILLGYARNINEATNILDQIEHLYARSQGVVIKRDREDPTDITVLESKRTEMPFDRYIAYHDEMILRRMLVGQKLFEGGGGTYGPKVPLDIILMRFGDFRLELIEIMNELLEITSELNWNLDEAPRLEFAPLTTMDQAQLRETIWEAMDRKVVSPDETWIREELGFPPEQIKAQLSRTLPGRYLVEPHAKWLATQYKTLIVATKPYSTYSHREIYIVGGEGIHGTMIEGEPVGPFSRTKIEEKYRELHRISTEEWDEWWPHETDFWIWYKPKILKKLDPPLEYSVPEGVQTYIKTVTPTSPMPDSEGGSE